MDIPGPRRPDPAAGPRGPFIYDQLRAEFDRIGDSYAGGPGVGRHRLTGRDDETEEIPVSEDAGVDAVTEQEVIALEPPADIPAEEQTVATCGQEG